jgi:hypothetical protein
MKNQSTKSTKSSTCKKLDEIKLSVACVWWNWTNIYRFWSLFMKQKQLVEIKENSNSKNNLQK